MNRNIIPSIKCCCLIILLGGNICLYGQTPKHSYKELFQNSIHTCNLSILFGGIKDNYYNYNFAIGASVCIYGLHFDMAFMNPAFSGTTSVGTWDDSMAYSLHGGFQFPIVENLTVTPLFGIAKFSYGKTDGYHYYVNSSGINNLYIPEEVYQGFDYGINVQYAFKKDNQSYIDDTQFKVDITVTRLTLFFGIGAVLR